MIDNIDQAVVEPELPKEDLSSDSGEDKDYVEERQQVDSAEEYYSEEDGVRRSRNKKRKEASPPPNLLNKPRQKS